MAAIAPVAPPQKSTTVRSPSVPRLLRAAFTVGEEKTARQAELEQIWAAFASEKYAAAKSKAEQALDLID